MRYMMLWKPGFEGGPPPTRQHMDEMGQLIEEMAQAGVLITTDGLADSDKGLRIRLAHGKYTITDGPFAETKELIAGYCIVKVDSKDEAIFWSKKFLSLMNEGETEVRLMHDFAPT